MSALLFNPDLVRKAIAVLVEPGNVFEIRALDAKLVNQRWKSTASGYFDSADAVVTALPTISTAKSIYITLNPVVPDLLARRSNRLDYAEKSETTSDHHIITRRWLLIDCDPERPAGISSNDVELKAALERADKVEAFLAGHGWAPPVKAMSGNDGFAMRFTAKILPVELALEKIPPLMAKVRAIYDLPFPPDSRPGCKDCRLLGNLVEMLTSPLPNDERERLKWKLRELREWLEFSMFERGITDEETRSGRLALSAAKETNAKHKAEQKRLRLEIRAVERQLRGG